MSTVGVSYLNNRYHDPVTGQFISVDPLVQQTGEPYIYGSSNPITLSDPTGLCSSFMMNAKGDWTCTFYTRDDGSRSVDNQGGDLCNRGARICSVDQGKLPADYVFGDQKPDKYRGIPTSLLTYEAPRDPFDPSGWDPAGDAGRLLARFTTLDEIPLALWEYASLRASGASQGPGLPAEVKPLTTEEFQRGMECVAALARSVVIASNAGAAGNEGLRNLEQYAANRFTIFALDQGSRASTATSPSYLSCVDRGR